MINSKKNNPGNNRTTRKALERFCRICGYNVPLTIVRHKFLKQLALKAVKYNTLEFKDNDSAKKWVSDHPFTKWVRLGRFIRPHKTMILSTAHDTELNDVCFFGLSALELQNNHKQVIDRYNIQTIHHFDGRKTHLCAFANNLITPETHKHLVNDIMGLMSAVTGIDILADVSKHTNPFLEELLVSPLLNQ